jgi:hypothetical protein
MFSFTARFRLFSDCIYTFSYYHLSRYRFSLPAIRLPLLFSFKKYENENNRVIFYSFLFVFNFGCNWRQQTDGGRRMGRDDAQGYIDDNLSLKEVEAALVGERCYKRWMDKVTWSVDLGIV